MFDDKIYKFLENSGPIFFVTPTVGRAIGLEDVLPDYHIIYCQKFDSAELLRAAGAKLYRLEKNFKNSGKILSDPEVIKYIKDNAQGKTPNIITFKPSPMIEMVCERNGFCYLGNNSRINREWEDKIKFAEITTALGVPNAFSRIIKIEKEKIEELRSSLDFQTKKCVIQFSRGNSGNSTFIVDEKQQLSSILEENIGRKVKLSDFIEGDTYTFDVCITESGFHVSQPIFQITGWAELNRNALGTCGNDYSFGKKLGEETIDGLHNNIKKVVDKISSLDYRGILGFDFVVGGGEVHLIEVNPRQVGSIPVFTKLQLASGEIPFSLFHILSFLDFDFQGFEIKAPRQDFAFSQIILRNVKSSPRVVKKSMQSGIYRLDGDEMEFMRAAYFADEKMVSGEFFLAVSSEGELIDPDMEYANIQVSYGIMETRSSFTEEFARIKDNVLKNIILS